MHGLSIPLVQLQEKHGLVQADLRTVQILQSRLNLAQDLSFWWRQRFHQLELYAIENYVRFLQFIIEYNKISSSR